MHGKYLFNVRDKNTLFLLSFYFKQIISRIVSYWKRVFVNCGFISKT